VGLVANRLLESYKARQALRTTLAEERLPKIRAALERLEDLRYRSDRVLDVIFWTANRWLRNRAESDNPLDREIAQQRVNYSDRELYKGPLGGEFRSIFERKLSERQALTKEIDVARETAEKERFWLGAAIMNTLDLHYGELRLRLDMPDIAFEHERIKRVTTQPRGRRVFDQWILRRRIRKLMLVHSGSRPGLVDVDMAARLAMRDSQ
jgi:hypothetical protein